MTGKQEHASKTLLELAVDLSPAGMLAVDEQGTILLVNREIERLFGYERDELLGQSVDLLVPGHLRADHPGNRQRFFQHPRARPMGIGRDLFGLRKDGQEVLVEIGLNPISTDHGLCVLCSIVDISARRQTEEQLRQAQKLEAIGTLAGGVAHDFNNILLAIVGHAELLQTGSTLDTQQQQDLAQILKAAERGRQLVQRILTFSRQSEVAKTPLNPRASVHEILQLLRASIPRSIEIDERLDENTPSILSDETQLHQVVMNLATNAAQAMPDGGLLEVGLGPWVVKPDDRLANKLRPGLYTRLSVRDAGEGMPPEIMERALEPFFTTKGPGRGTGLGLAVVHGIVESHQGTMEINSVPGQGTQVDIYFPAHITKDAVANTTDNNVDTRRHILLVEDEVAIASMLKRQINTLGYQVTVHTSSLAALETFRAQPQAFDLLITDNSMPKMTGLALAQEILQQRPNLPVLLISGIAEVADHAELHALGITAILAKPHSMQQLRQVVSQLLPG